MDRPLLLNSYAAKTCLHALHLQVVTEPGEALPVPDAVLHRMEGGVEFERLVGTRLETLAESAWVFLPPGRDRIDDEAGWRADRQTRLAQTVSALESSASVIWNPLLPPDISGHRSGEPDLVLLATTGGHYFPLDVKAHRVARAGSANLHPFEHPLASLLGKVPSDELLPTARCGHLEDLLQLAHYDAMLAALGLAPDDLHYGAIIGLASDGSGEPVVTWVDLNEVGLRYRTDLSLEVRSGSVRDYYRDAFSDALAVSERAHEIAAGEALPPLSEPWFAEGICSSCAWRKPCGDQMLTMSHVSLVRPLSALRLALRANEIRTVENLAHVEDEQLLARPAWRQAVRRARMALAGEAVPMALYPELRTNDVAPRLWRRPDASSSWPIARADVELDVDMECTEAFVYLWGTLLSYPNQGVRLAGYEPGYRGFGGSFPEMSEAAQCEVFLDFWAFLDAVRTSCVIAGVSFKAFGYNLGSAEDRWMNRCAALLDANEGGVRWAGRLAALRNSGDWLDLLPAVRSRFESLNGLGLKLVATSLGFKWRDEDPGGANSMFWYAIARDDADENVRAAYLRRLLDYNEDDVKATLFIRDWLSSHEPEALDALSEDGYQVATRPGET